MNGISENRVHQLIEHHNKLLVDKISIELKNFYHKEKESLRILEDRIEMNMKSINSMMLELKELIAMVRASARKNEWYGSEVEGKLSQEIINEADSLEELDKDAKPKKSKKSLPIKIDSSIELIP